MGEIHSALCEIHSIGQRTREWLVGRNTCPALAGHGISLCGVSEARPGFHFSRRDPAMAQLLACERGVGRVLIGGRWVCCGAGQAYLTPPGRPHAYRATGAWWLVWFHLESMDVAGPALIRVDARALLVAVQGLYRESIGLAEPAVMQTWATLAASIARRSIGPLSVDPRLQELWLAVGGELSRAWSLPQLAELAEVSGETLRRLCARQLGASPMQYLAQLRMRRADALLRTGAYAVGAVAALVGYSDPFAFSVAFRRQFGVSPSSVVPK
jgi:AraC-like DNA-binding protein